MPKPAVYIETSVVSYLTARPSRDLVLAGHQQVTVDWWEIALPKYRPHISTLVLDEAASGDRDAAKRRLEMIAGFKVLDIVAGVRELADLYFMETPIPEKARADTYHLALATWHGMDLLVSWNFAHIVGVQVQTIVEQINTSRGIRTPIICTPEAALEV